MRVTSGYGESTHNYIGFYKGLFFRVETKKPGDKPTDRQNMIIERMRKAGGAVFVIDGDLSELKTWIDNPTEPTT